MPNHQKMYAIICSAASEALDVLQEDADKAKRILQRALYEAEEIYINTTADEDLAEFKHLKGEFVHDLVDKMLRDQPADKVYVAIGRLWGEMTKEQNGGTFS